MSPDKLPGRNNVGKEAKAYHFGDGIRESAKKDPEGLLESLRNNFSGLGAAFVFKVLDEARSQKGSTEPVESEE